MRIESAGDITVAETVDQMLTGSDRLDIARSCLLRVLVVLVALSLVLTVVLTVSVAPGWRGLLVDLRGEPLQGAFVAYYWKGYRFNLVDSITYQRPGTILRTDSEGRFRIRGFVHLHRPLDSRLSPWITLVYVPRLHHAFGPLASATESIPGRVEIDREGTLVRAALADLSEDPDRWSRSMELLYSLIAYDLDPDPGDYKASASVRRELAGHLVLDYAAFVQRHASTPRSIDPDSAAYLDTLSPEEREERLTARRVQLEREPLWGQWMERLWDDKLQQLGELTLQE
jgi:hypothetical protein